MSDNRSHRFNWIALLLLGLAAIPVLIPAGIEFVLSRRAYTPVQGLFTSPVVGWQNYSAIMAQFPRLLTNSFVLWLVSLAGALLLGLAAALSVSRIRNRKIAATSAGLLLLPAFVPPICYFVLAYRLLSAAVFTNNSSYVWGFLAQTLLPGAAVIAFAGAATGLVWRSRGRNPLAGTLQGCLGAVLLYCCLMLTPSFETTQLSYNPLVYQSADILDTYQYRMSLQQNNLGTGAAAFILRSVLQALLAVIPALILAYSLRRQDQALQSASGSGLETIDRKTSLAVLPWLAAVLLGLAALLAIGMPGSLAKLNIGSNLLMAVPTVLIALLAGAIFALLILSGAQQASRSGLVIFAVIMLAPANAIIGHYLVARQFGLINTIFPTALTVGLLPPALLLLLVFALLLRGSRNRQAILLFSLGAACLIGALAYGHAFPNILFVTRSNLLSVGALLKNVFSSQAAQDQPLLASIYSVALLPCLAAGLAGAALVRAAIWALVKPAESL